MEHGSFCPLSLPRVLSFDPLLKRLVSNPPVELRRLRNATLFSLTNVSVPAGATRELTTAGSAMDLEMTLALPASSAQPLAFGLEVLAGAAPGGNATTVSLSISAATDPSGTRNGTLLIVAPRITNTSWDPWGAMESNFTLLKGESVLDLRVVVDRSIVEVWVGGGRAAISIRDFPAEGETAARLRHSSRVGALRVERLEGWGMGCGWQ